MMAIDHEIRVNKDTTCQYRDHFLPKSLLRVIKFTLLLLQTRTTGNGYASGDFFNFFSEQLRRD